MQLSAEWIGPILSYYSKPVKDLAISGCNVNECRLKQKTKVKASIVFQSPANTNFVKPWLCVWLSIFKYCKAFDPPNDNACNFMNPGCPLVKNRVYNASMEVTVPEHDYDNTGRFYLYDGTKSEMVCVDVRVVISA
ncbi:hypothetical protein CRM22_005511 [Opisthorchis felineus]|uniref:MD-2-related lipid-recognition domain-containing protein n=1 Tax=Opisthorchis felineus TaxID=147828 RepID=A0A4S2LQR1_OPIFE|nr:hypothetical protein CRM22_005511 [Opisthorchis felineus]